VPCAAVVLDRPHAADTHEAVPIGGDAFKARRDTHRLRRTEAEADAAIADLAAAAATAGQRFEVLRLDDAPEPALLRAGALHDLIVIGRDSTLGQEDTDDGLAPVIEALLRGGARPLLVVPPDAAPFVDGGAAAVLVAYDGSLPAMRAIQGFALLRLAEGAPVRVICVDDDPAEGRRLVAEAAGFLRRHGMAATEAAIQGGRPAERLLAEAAALPARVLVMGAFGTAGWRGLLLGAATRRLLRAAPCAMALRHVRPALKRASKRVPGPVARRISA
jgi:nucleotide-binding universal stress UspA family protein